MARSLVSRSIAGAAGALALAVGFSNLPAHAAETVKVGTFKGVSGHKSSGSMQIVRDGEAFKIVIKDDFVLKDAPDPKLAWGKDGYRKGTIWTKLVKLKGAQEYAIPAGTDLSQFNEFWLWCERYNVGLAVAKLN